MGDPARARAWLADIWSPAVMVVASPETDAACLASTGLTVVELLRPFGVIPHLNGTVGVPIRTAAEHPVRLHSWRLRFYAPQHMFQPSPAAADAHLRGVLSAAAAAGVMSPVPDLDTLIHAGSVSEAAPWFEVYRTEFFRMMAFGEHETMDHPVACLLVVPSTHRGGMGAAFEELYARAPLPPLMRSGAMESSLLRLHLVLHDARASSAEDLERAEMELRAVSSQLGSACQILTINHGSEETPVMDPRFWISSMEETLPGGGAGEPPSRTPTPAEGLGRRLAPRDVEALGDYVREAAVRVLIPHLEARIRGLNAHVSDARRGLRNQLKSLLWRGASAGGGAAAAPASPRLRGEGPSPRDQGDLSGARGGAPPPLYPSGSLVHRMRSLADLALMLGDVDGAASTLRLLAADLKADRAFRHYAGAQEALGVCAALSGAPSAEVNACLREAFYRHSQGGGGAAGARSSSAAPGAPGPAPERQGVRYATRAALMLTEYCRGAGLHGDAVWILMKAHYREDNTGAGLLLEQAAHSLLRLQPPRARKFAFHLVLAGLRYGACDQDGLAQRCYRQVLEVYRGKGWGLVEEHLHDVLGRYARELGDLASAARCHAALLGAQRSGPGTQRSHLDQLYDAVRLAAAKEVALPPLELPLPEMDLERPGLVFQGQTWYGNAAARQAPAELWRPLERAVVGDVREAGPSWLDGAAPQRAQRRVPVCCVGEPVSIDLRISNPLSVDLEVSRLRLVCRLEAGAGAASSAPGATSGSRPTDVADGVEVWEERLRLRAGEATVVCLRAAPRRRGTLHLDAVAWTLDGAADGLRPLAVRQPLPLKPGTGAVCIDAARPPAAGFRLEVGPALPCLELALEGLSPTCLAGQVALATLRLRNAGGVPLAGLRLAGGAGWHLAGAVPAPGIDGHALSLGQRLLVSSEAGDWAAGGVTEGAEPVQAPGPPALRGQFALKNLAWTLVPGTPARLYSAPEVQLAPGEELSLPCVIRLTRPGPRLLCIAASYRVAGGAVQGAAQRSTRCAFETVVQPSLQLSAAVAAGTCEPGAALLQLGVVNLQGLEAFELHRPRCPGWTSSDMGGGLEGGAHGDAGDSPAAPPPRVDELAAGGAVTRHAWLRRRDPARPLPADCDVVLPWLAAKRAGAGARRGLSAVPRQLVRPGPRIHALLAPAAPGPVTHPGFQEQPLCRVPLVLRLWTTAPAHVVVELGGAADEAEGAGQGGSGTAAPAAPLAHVWAGRTRRALGTLRACSELELELEVLVSRPGRHALADVSLAWGQPGARQLDGSRPVPGCLIEVVEAGPGPGRQGLQ
ncbi:TRS85 [Auxenochlorella protothecoides x Auxenochlorella symbiontica]